MYPVAAYPDSSWVSAAYPYGVEVKFNVIFTVTDCAGYTGTYRVSIEDVRYDDDLATPLMMLVEHTHNAERGNCVTSSWPVELEDLLQRGVVSKLGSHPLPFDVRRLRGAMDHAEIFPWGSPLLSRRPRAQSLEAIERPPTIIDTVARGGGFSTLADVQAAMNALALHLASDHDSRMYNERIHVGKLALFKKLTRALEADPLHHLAGRRKRHAPRGSLEPVMLYRLSDRVRDVVERETRIDVHFLSTDFKSCFALPSVAADAVAVWNPCLYGIASNAASRVAPTLVPESAFVAVDRDRGLQVYAIPRSSDALPVLVIRAPSRSTELVLQDMGQRLGGTSGDVSEEDVSEEDRRPFCSALFGTAPSFDATIADFELTVRTYKEMKRPSESHVHHGTHVSIGTQRRNQKTPLPKLGRPRAEQPDSCNDALWTLRKRMEDHVMSPLKLAHRRAFPMQALLLDIVHGRGDKSLTGGGAVVQQHPSGSGIVLTICFAVPAHIDCRDGRGEFTECVYIFALILIVAGVRHCVGAVDYDASSGVFAAAIDGRRIEIRTSMCVYITCFCFCFVSSSDH